MASEQQKEVPTDPSLTPSGAGEGEEGAGPSKKGAKKAEAKAKKEAEKARKAAERAAAEGAQKAAASEDLAKDNYGTDSNILTKSNSKITAPITSLKDIGDEHVDKLIKLQAYVQNSRAQGAKMVFVELRQRVETVQGVLAATADGKAVSKQMVKWLQGVKLESAVLVEATVRKAPEPVKSCSVSGYELHLSKVYLVATAPEMLMMGMGPAAKAAGRLMDEEDGPEGVEDLAITEGGIPTASLATHLDNPAMHKRAPVSQAISKIRSEVQRLFRGYLYEHGFTEFSAPSFIGAASEGGANVFQVPYFKTTAYLAQSPQFYKQIEIAGGMERVFCVGPVFRAENSNTTRHMTEFIGLDLEMEIKENYHEVLHMLEGLLLHIFRNLAKDCRKEIEVVRSVYPSEEFLLPEPGKEVRLTFAEGQALLRAERPEEYGLVSDHEDMSTAQEKALGAVIREKFKTDFYVLDKFPVEARPFYAMPDPENPKVTNAYDFFMRNQEILSGGQRLHLPAELEASIRAKGVDPEQPGIKEYVDVFKSVGVVPHGGGGIGLDRVVAWYLGLPSVHLSASYPRTPNRLKP